MVNMKISKSSNLKELNSMKKLKKEVKYRVVSGSPDGVAFWPCKTLKQARQTKKEVHATNPHQGGGYHIVKATTTFKVIK